MFFLAFAALCLGALDTAIAPSANAGAPNYECIAKGVRIGIDQHRNRALVRWDGHGIEPGTTKNSDQNGERLGIEIVTTSRVWEVEVSGFGKSVVIDGPAGNLTGTCTNVAGNLVLARTTQATTIRSLGATTAKGKIKNRAVVTIPSGTFVWNAGNFDPTSAILGPKDQNYIAVVSGLPNPMNHMNVTGIQGWVPAAAVMDVCGVYNRKPGWDPACR